MRGQPIATGLPGYAPWSPLATRPLPRRARKDNRAGTAARAAGLCYARSDPELVGEVVEVLAHDIERTLGLALAGTRTAFARPPDMAGA